MTYGLDTSVIVRILTNDPPELSGAVAERIEEMRENGDDFFVSDLAVSETYFALQQHYRQTKEAAILALKALSAEPGFALSTEATAALSTPGVWKANPGFIDRVLVSEYAAKGFVTLSCEKSFRRLDLAEVIC